MSEALTELSHALDELHEEFAAHHGCAVSIAADAVDVLTRRLALMAKLGRNMEIELQVHRLGEANRAGRAMAEELATDVLRNVLTETGGNVVHANFRRGS